MFIRENNSQSLPEVHSSIAVPEKANFFRTLRAFVGPGLLVAVGYMDPGNWATDLAGGARFGYTLLSVILISNCIAMILQHLSLKLGIATGRDLAQACRDAYSPKLSFFLWVICEIAIAACDLAEVIGSAIALNLLFGLPLTVGILLTALDVLIILGLQHRGFRLIECLVGSLILTIGIAFFYQIFIAAPNISEIAHGLIPSRQILENPLMLYIAIGIMGATVMPHNLYLHSSIVQTRPLGTTERERGESLTFATLDSTLALTFAFLINAAILILAAASFHASGHTDVVELSDAYSLLSPLLGSQLAPTLFAIALIACGLNATVTATLAGQIVMEGFLGLRFSPVVRRLATRLVAVVPAAWVAIMQGDQGATGLLVLSQVVLSLQLPFAVIPLVAFTAQRRRMGKLVAPRWLTILAASIALTIVILNGILVKNLLF